MSTLHSDSKVAPAMHQVYLGLGSNLQDRRRNLETALQQLRPVVKIEISSSIYETEPIGYLAQPPFLNMVCLGRTQCSPMALLQQVKAIEVAIGRLSTFRNGPRLIDIDILLYDDQIVAEKSLTIPHPRMHERAFVLVPLAEIAPRLVDPVSSKTMKDLLRNVSQESVTKTAIKVSL